MTATIKIVEEHTGLPVSHFRTATPDFPGDPQPQAWTDDVEHRIICSVCGLIEKAATADEAKARGDRHLRMYH